MGAGSRARARRSVALAVMLLATAVALLPGASASTEAGPAPVFAGDFPDPFVIRVERTYYAFSTNAGANVPVLRSTDLRTWEPLGDALPVLPGWVRPGRTWAPSVLRRANTYVLYYTAHDSGSGRQCISRATSLTPQGPYVDGHGGPMICQAPRGGSIDPSPFVDAGGAAYLHWKSEGIGAEPARIWGQRLAPDGRSLVERPVALLHADQAWEGAVVEGPSMVRAGGRHWLFYSANRWASHEYAVGYAACTGPLGPCRKAGGPALWSRPHLSGPGGQEFVTDPDGGIWMAYHAWGEGAVGYPHGRRSLRIEGLDVAAGGRPVLGRRLGPS